MKHLHSNSTEAVRRALSDSLRLRIYETLQAGPRTARQLGEALGRNPNRLYYHLRILEEAGLVAESGRDVSGRMVERILEAVPFDGDSRALGQGDPADRAMFFGSLLEATRSELVDSMVDQAEGRPLKLRFTRAIVRTTPDGFARMEAGMEALLAEVRRLGDEPDATDYRMTFALYETGDAPRG